MRETDTNSAAGRAMSERAFDIEKQSLGMIDAEIGDHGYDEAQWAVVRRIIHATADFDFAGRNKVVFHPAAIMSAFEAIGKRCTIVTDVDMVLVAINKKSVADFALKAVCRISDAEIAQEARRLGKTRSEISMRKSANDVRGGIVAIGNAPTALYEIIRIVREGIAKPALIVGVPVGFVSAAESKDALTRLDVPYITNVGRKGGSPAASAIVNAILLLYKTAKLSP